MRLIPIRTRRIASGDDVVPLFQNGLRLGDILVVSSKAVAVSEGRAVDLRTLTVTEEAKTLSKSCGRSPSFCQAVLTETALRNGRIAGTCPGAVLTELKPKGLTQGTIFAANAGMDESNIERGFAVGWPEDPVGSVRRLRKTLSAFVGAPRWGALIKELLPRTFLPRCLPQGAPAGRPYTQTNGSPDIAVLLSDSCLRPRRWGVTAYALAVSGIDPLRDEAGRNDLFGKPLRITKEAIADQLATAANFLMGNADQSVPAVIIRDHGLELSDFEGWVPGIEPGEDIFHELP